MYLFFFIVMMAGEPHIYWYNNQQEMPTKAACEAVADRMMVGFEESHDASQTMAEHGCVHLKHSLKPEFYDRHSA